MNIHLPAILMWTTGVQGFDPSPNQNLLLVSFGDVFVYLNVEASHDIKSEHCSNNLCRYIKNGQNPYDVWMMT